ncbi:MAG: LuxR C-terminal-related transcriptional regulator [Solirubrobacteraceae bacterium]
MIVLSQHVDADYALTLLHITGIATLAAAISHVTRGETVVDPQNWSTCSCANHDALTTREREVLALLAEGLTDRGISERLWLTPKTVEIHVRDTSASSDSPPIACTTGACSTF